MNASSPTVLHVDGLAFAYGREDVICDVSFDVAHGEFVSIIGPNGAGKSTILKSVMRLLPVDRGRIEIDGHALSGLGQRQLAQTVSYVPQELRGTMPWTVREFVLMGRYPYVSTFREYSRRDQQVVDEVMALTGVTPLADREMTHLSGGEGQTVMITAALAQEADLLLLDEPGTFLDPRHQDEINALLHRLARREDKAILMVTHDINAAAINSDRVLALKDGRLVFGGSPAELMCNDVLKRVFDKEFALVRHPHTDQIVIVPEALS